MRSEDDRGTLFRIHLAKSDMLLVIGKAGKSIAAVRYLMKLYTKARPTISLIPRAGAAEPSLSHLQ